MICFASPLAEGKPYTTTYVPLAPQCALDARTLSGLTHTWHHRGRKVALLASMIAVLQGVCALLHITRGVIAYTFRHHSKKGNGHLPSANPRMASPWVAWKIVPYSLASTLRSPGSSV